MIIQNITVKSSESSLTKIDVEFLASCDAYDAVRAMSKLANANEAIKIVPKRAVCCERGTAPKTPIPDKIFRCGDVTTVIWKDGTKTTVKLMPGAEDSDYGAFTAALAKKIYGGNGKVMKYVGMVQRVKSKAEKKAERKAKHKAESENQGEKKYIVSQYGQVAECKGVETEEMGVGEKVVVYATTEDHARVKACHAFDKVHGMNGYLVYSDGDCFRTEITERDKLGKWCYYSIVNKHLIRVFARDSSQALRVLKINPAPIPF